MSAIDYTLGVATLVATSANLAIAYRFTRTVASRSGVHPNCRLLAYNLIVV